MTLKVVPESFGTKRFHLWIYAEGTRIGEYETSQEADIQRKIGEVAKAEEILRKVYETRGEFQVRWDGNGRKKSVRVDGTEVATIPKEMWGRPSWQ